MAEIKYKVKGEHDKSALNDLKSGLGGVESALTAAFSNPLVAITAAQVCIDKYTAAIVSATKAVVDFIASANEAEQNTIRLGTVQQLTFDKTKITLLELNKQISEISSKTLFDDDAVSQAQSALLVFDNINNTNFDKALKSAADLASFLGTDLKSAAEKLGKALNDPSQALSQLERSGITFTDAQEKMIKKMYETGDVAGAQKIIFDKLDSTIGGLAEKMGGSATASAVKFKQATDDLKEGLGILVASGLGGFFDFLTKIIDSLNEATQKIKELNEAVKTGQITLGGVATPAEQRIAIVQSEIKLLEYNLQSVERALITLGQKGFVTAADKSYSVALSAQQKELKDRLSVLVEIVKNLQKPEEAAKYNALIKAEQEASQAMQKVEQAVTQNTKVVQQQIAATEKTAIALEEQRVIAEEERNTRAAEKSYTGQILPDMSIFAILGDMFAPFISSLSDAILKIDNVAKVFNAVGTIVSGVIDIIGTMLNSAFEPLVNVLLILGRTIGALLLPVINLLAPVIKIISDGLLWLYNNAIRHLANGIIFILNTIMALIGYIWNGIAAAINALLGWAGVKLGYMNVPSPTQGFLQAITPEQQTTTTSGSNYSGAAASYSGKQNITNNIWVSIETINGTNREAALAFLEEIKSAIRLGLASY